MCGIAYKHSLDGTPVNNDILSIFDNQRERGTEGFGLFNGSYMVHAAKEDRILNWLSKRRNDSPLILFHHRYPTTTANVKRAAHPFSTRKYFGDTEYILVHNGGVKNSDELKKKHEKKKVKYFAVLQDGTYNDSEAFLWDLAFYLEGKQKTLTAKGPCAFICMKVVKGELKNMYFGRNYDRPLWMSREKDSLQISSKGKGSYVFTNRLYNYNYKQNRLYERHLIVPTEYEYDKGYFWSNESEPGDWLPSSVRAKFARIYPPFRNSSSAPNYLPSGETEEEVILYPTDSEIQTTALFYLGGVDGVFEKAYSEVEKDYLRTFDFPDSKTNYEEQLLLERVMEYLENDPEYITENSQSSMFIGESA